MVVVVDWRRRNLLYQLHNDKDGTSGRCARTWVGLKYVGVGLVYHGIEGLEHLGTTWAEND